MTYQLAAQAAAAAGMGTACIEIGTANGVLQSPVFALKIVANPMQDDAVKDTDDYKTVAEAVAAANLVNQNLDAILAAPDYAAQAKQSETQAGTYKDAAAQSAEAAADSAADAKSSAAALSSAAILTYTHRRSEGVHMLTPPAGKTAYTNAIIRFVAAADFTAGDVFYIGTTTLRGTYANGEALDTGAFVTGETVLVCRNDKKLTFKGGGGLSGADLALADAAAADVLESKTFYSGGAKLLKTGTILTHNTVDKNGAVGINAYYPTVPTTPVEGNTQVGTGLDGVNRRNLQPPAGYYDGTSYIGDTDANVAAAIGLSAAKLMSGQQVLGIDGTGLTRAVYYGGLPTDYSAHTMGTAPASGTLLFVFAGRADHDMQIQSITIGGQVVATPGRNNLYVAQFSVAAGQQIIMQWTNNFGGGTPSGYGVICYV